MPLQPDLIGPQPLTVTRATGVTGPRLWVRRLVIWKEPAGEKIRDISLAPGLNIIWSPDGADDAAAGGQTNAIGHGSGKTLFCRLIRYCLGEDRFATEAQRERIGTALLNGLVGAEVILEGTCWAIVRPLGVRRRHMAVSNGNLEEIAAGEGSSTGLEPFIQAIEQSIITPGLAELIRPGTGGAVWPVALAWLTRDQECRFDDVLDWRSPASDSDSPLPASGREKGPRLEALRAFLMAITPEEQATRTQVVGLDEQRRLLDQEIGHRRWEIERSQARLIPALGLADQTLPEMPLMIDILRKAAAERVAVAAKLPAGGNAELLAARKEFETARSEWTRLDGERIRIEASIPVEERLLSQIQGELPGLSFSKIEANSPVCPICEVPIDRALAEGCKLSHKIPDAAACQQRWARRQTDFQEQNKRLQDLRLDRMQVLQQVALAKQKFEQLRDRVVAIEKARDSREAAWYSARRLQDDIERLSDFVTAQDAATKSLREMTAKVDGERARLGAFRDKQARVFGALSEKFDPIVRRLLGHDAKGRVTLSATAIELSIDLGGDRVTAAIDSLKILAFDLAAMSRSIEGATRVPAFLLHDSPREADLGLSIYHELFRLVRDLEATAEQPPFQYIVTTTTEPPEAFKDDPRLRLIIRAYRLTNAFSRWIFDVILPEDPPGFIVRTEAHKAASANGSRLERGIKEGWLSFGSTTAQVGIWIAGVSKNGPWLLSVDRGEVCAEFSPSPTADSSGPGVATFAFDTLQALYAALDRIYRLGISLPDAPFQAFQSAVRDLPLATEAERLVIQRVGVVDRAWPSAISWRFQGIASTGWPRASSAQIWDATWSHNYAGPRR